MPETARSLAQHGPCCPSVPGDSLGGRASTAPTPAALATCCCAVLVHRRCSFRTTRFLNKHLNILPAKPRVRGLHKAASVTLPPVPSNHQHACMESAPITRCSGPAEDADPRNPQALVLDRRGPRDRSTGLLVVARRAGWMPVHMPERAPSADRHLHPGHGLVLKC